MRSSFFGLLVLASPAVAASDPVPPVAPQTVLEPVAAEKITYYDAASNTMKQVYWASIPEAQKRNLMPSAEAYMQLAQVDASGRVSILPLSASVAKGRYQLTFRWQQYRADYCQAANPNAGRIRTGVALEIVADIVTKKSGLNIVNLGPLSVSAEKGEVAGSILIRQIGLGNSSPTLGTYLSNFQLTREGVIKALEAIAVTKAVLENEKTILTPHYLSITESAPGACTAVTPANVKPVI